MFTERNHKTVQEHCPECGNTPNKKDPIHDITYCTHCGLILIDNTTISITTEMHRDKQNEKRIRQLWHKRIDSAAYPKQG